MAEKIDRVYVGASSIISSLGVGVSTNVDSILSFTTNISEYDNTPVCVIDRNSLDCQGLERYTFAEQLAILAINDVAQKSSVAVNSGRTAIVISTTKGNVELVDSDFERAYLWSLSNNIKEHFECKNTPVIISTACISGVAAVIVGARMIEDCQVDNVYVIGVDVVSRFVVAGFNSFKSISPTVCRPYDSSGDGLTLGEGCGVLLLTKYSDKSISGITISGGGLSNDANHISGPSRSGDGLFLAIDKAMKQANIVATDLDYINMHGTGTVFNDQMESKAMNMAGLLSVPCNSLKPYLGHTLGASGVIETILVVEQMHRGVIFGVKGYCESGVPFELNVSAEHRSGEINHVVKTASGFGGTNGAIVLSKESVLKSVTKDKYTVQKVEELSHIEMCGDTKLPFVDYIKGEYRALGDANIKFFKMDRLSKLGYIASCKLLKGIDIGLPQDRVSVILANRSSSLDTDLKHQGVVNKNLPEGASPAIFVYTLPNIVAAEIAIKHRFQGESVFVVEQTKSMDSLASYAQKLIDRDICDAVIYGWCELLGEDYNVELKLIRKI